MSENYKKFVHDKCEFYPCHKMDNLNCLFCYCPFYFADKCPGTQFTMTTAKNGSVIKDCSNCTWIHDANNYDKIMDALRIKLKVPKEKCNLEPNIVK